MGLIEILRDRVEPPVEPSGADLYRLNCQSCHRAEGTGSPPEPPPGNEAETARFQEVFGMAINRRTMAVGALIASVWGGVELSAEAQNQRLPMRVVVYDYTDSEPAILQQAQRAGGQNEKSDHRVDHRQKTRNEPYRIQSDNCC